MKPPALLATYSMPVISSCPVDGQQDVYDLTVASDRTVMVETIIAAVREAIATPMLQEAMAEFLANRLGQKVTLEGVHSGVRVTVTALPGELPA